MKFNELAGDAQVDPAHTVKMVTSWFRAEDRFVIVGMKSVRGPGKNVVSQVVQAKEFAEELRSPRGPDILEGLSLSPDGTRWDLYVSLATVEGEVSLSRRGDLDAIKDVPGVYVDLDVKPGSFESQEAAMAYLRGLPRPTLITLTGSGGVHAWWRFDEPVDADKAAEVQRSWYALLAERAAPVFIDHLVDASRIMRLPGAPRWPKAGEALPPRLATVHYRDLENRYSPEDLLAWSADAATRRANKVKATRAKDASHKIDTSAFADSDDGPWTSLMKTANVEEIFNELMSWDEILEPRGWTFLREDRLGRREWARPGSGSKSASTDFPGSESVMSLHSWSPDTGLADLKEAGIVLSRWRVAQRLVFDDDYDAIVAWTLANG